MAESGGDPSPIIIISDSKLLYYGYNVEESLKVFRDHCEYLKTRYAEHEQVSK